MIILSFIYHIYFEVLLKTNYVRNYNAEQFQLYYFMY